MKLKYFSERSQIFLINDILFFGVLVISLLCLYLDFKNALFASIPILLFVFDKRA